MASGPPPMTGPPQARLPITAYPPSAAQKADGWPKALPRSSVDAYRSASHPAPSAGPTHELSKQPDSGSGPPWTSQPNISPKQPLSSRQQAFPQVSSAPGVAAHPELSAPPQLQQARGMQQLNLQGPLVSRQMAASPQPAGPAGLIVPRTGVNVQQQQQQLHQQQLQQQQHLQQPQPQSYDFSAGNGRRVPGALPGASPAAVSPHGEQGSALRPPMMGPATYLPDPGARLGSSPELAMPSSQAAIQRPPASLQLPQGGSNGGYAPPPRPSSFGGTAQYGAGPPAPPVYRAQAAGLGPNSQPQQLQSSEGPSNRNRPPVGFDGPPSARGPLPLPVGSGPPLPVLRPPPQSQPPPGAQVPPQYQPQQETRPSQQQQRQQGPPLRPHYPAVPGGTTGGAGPAQPLSPQQQNGPASFEQPQPPPRFGPPLPPSFGMPSNGPQRPGQGHLPPDGRSPRGMPNSRVGNERSSSLRIDSTRVPRPRTSAVANADDSIVDSAIFETRQAGKHVLPPPIASNYVVHDCGNSSPRFIRMTLNYVPCNRALLKMSTMPLAAIIQPLAPLAAGEEPLQVVDCGEDGPPRCQRCKAYVNPFTVFTDGGRCFQCNLCSHTNATPDWYMSPLGMDGCRRDRSERAELCRGSVEFLATKEYMVRPPMPPTHFFLIDVSYTAICSGVTASACASIARVLDELPGGERAQIGVATFDSTIHFYSLRPSQAQPHMLVVPDIADPYSPESASLICNSTESRALVDSLLESIPRMFADSRSAECCTGAAIHAAIDVLAPRLGGSRKVAFFTLQGATGGKLHVFMSSLPRSGAHALRQREALMGTGSKDALAIMAPALPDYKALAVTAADAQVCVDVFVMSQSFADVATLKELCATTAGSLFHYQPFDAALDAEQFWNDFRWSIVRPQALEAVARLRCSTGLDVANYMGACYRRTSTDIDLPALHCDQAIAVQLQYDDRLAEHSEVYLQFALLYSSTAGERRIRVFNLGLPTTGVLGTSFRGADLGAQVAVQVRLAAATLPTGSLQAARGFATGVAMKPLYAYRRHCAVASNPGQLILPEALKLLPAYMLALEKQPCFRTETQHDARAVALFRLESLAGAAVMSLLHARLIALHLQDLDPVAEGEAQPRLDSLSLSSERLEPHGLYLLENGVDALIYIGKQAPARVVQELLGVESLELVSGPGSVPLTLPRLETPMSRGVNRVLDAVRQQRGCYMRTRVLKRGDPLEPAFFAALVEDRSPAGSSYVEFLCRIHREIMNKA